MGAITEWFAKLFKSANFVDEKQDVSAYYGYQDHYPSNFYTSGSDGSKYYRGLSASGSSPVLDNRMLMINARSAYHDTAAARAMVDRFADTIIGSGLRLNPAPNYTVLGISPEKAEQWADKVRESFDLWASSKKSLADESMNLYQAMRLMEISQQRDNDYFIRFHYRRSGDLQNPLQISFIDPLQIRGVGYTSTYGYQYYADGISRDQNGKETAYKAYLFNEKEQNYKEVEIPAVGVRSKLRMMAHGFRPDYANQGRGITRLGHMLQEFENITDFSLAQINKAINQSQITMYVKPSKDAPASNPLDAITHVRPSGPYGSDPNIPSNETFTGESTTEQYIRYLDVQEATHREPGSTGVFSLMEGEDLKVLENSAPSENFSQFIDSFTSYLSASNSMPIEILLQRFNANYSASRAALILYWRVCEMWRNELKGDVLDYIYESWLEGEIARGRISAPGWNDPVIRAAWLNNTWVGSVLPNIDPLVTARAHEMEIRQGAITLDEVARNANGSSGKANRIQLARELQELPIPPWDQKNTVPLKQEKPSEEEDEEDE